MNAECTDAQDSREIKSRAVEAEFQKSLVASRSMALGAKVEFMRQATLKRRRELDAIDAEYLAVLEKNGFR